MSLWNRAIWCSSIVIDFTKARPFTFYDGEGGQVVHTTSPNRIAMRGAYRPGSCGARSATALEGLLRMREGPRYETPAEILAYRRLGGDVVGMTNVPEVVLAREAGLCYAVIAMVTNFAAGISPTSLTHTEVVEVMQANSDRIRRLVMTVLGRLDPEDTCCCGDVSSH